MGRFDKLKDAFSKAASKAAETVVNTGKQLSENLKEVDLKSVADTVKNKTEELVETAKNTSPESVKESIKEMRANLSEKLATFKRNSEATDRAVEEALSSENNTAKKVSAENALKIMYLMMACDNTVNREESDKFDLIARDMLQDRYNEKEQIVLWCNKVIGSVEEKEDYYDTIRDGIAKVMQDAMSTNDGIIDSKILLWNLVVIAYSDGDYSVEEGKILRFVAKTMGIDKAFIPEMESSIQAIQAIEIEEKFLKSSDRRYEKIELELNELADRKDTIMQGIQALILD